MQQQKFESNSGLAQSDQSAPRDTEPHEQKQPQSRLTVKQRFQTVMLLLKVLTRVVKQDTEAHQIEDAMTKSFGQLNIPEEFIQKFKDGLEKQRQNELYSYLEDTYIMGGILIFCGILFPMLISLGTPDLPVRFAWIAFALTFTCVVGFFLIRFLKEKNSISSRWRIHSMLSLLAGLGVLTATTSLFFHVWNVVGWTFLLCALVLFFVYCRYRWNIYYRPFLGIFRDILKRLNDLPQKG